MQRGSGDERRLRGTPASLKKFVRARLNRLYRMAGSKPRCATAPVVTIGRYRSGGFVSASEGWYSPCPGGGVAITYVRSGGTWRAVLPTQEIVSCADLQWFELPVFIAGRACWSDTTRPRNIARACGRLRPA